MTSLDIDSLEFDRCEDEPIHVPESIQGYGYLFALDRNLAEIQIVSENVADFLAQGADVLGTPFFDLLDPEQAASTFLRDTYDRARTRETRLPVQVRFRRDVVREGHPTDFFAVVYDSHDRFIIELEPAATFRQSYSAQHHLRLYAISIAPKFKALKSLNEMAQEIVDTIRFVTKMDRVVLYKLNDDGSGRVIAEAREDDMESYLDLYYPASDIPPQARELYKKNWVRITPDVDLPPSRLIPRIDATGREPLDLTHSILRSLSPIHCQYIRNQGLRASMSMSLVTHDKLWGMISCHNREPNYVPQNVRLECENISQLFSWHLYAKEEELLFRKREQIDDAISTMLSGISARHPIGEVFRENEQQVLSIMDADGFVFFSHPELVALGEHPPIEALRSLHGRLRRSSASPVVTSNIGDLTDETAGFEEFPGLLLIPLMERGEHFTAWFRREKRFVQKWAGLPAEKSATASKRERLTPRSSFEVHVREISGRSREWSQSDREIAERFNRIFTAQALETQERMRRNLTDLRRQNRYRNEFLATLAHELRNPLAPINSGLSILEIDPGPEKTKDVVQRMKRQVGAMTRMIDDLMEVSRITNGKVKLSRQPIVVQDVLRESLAAIESLIQEKGHLLEVDMPRAPLRVDADPTRLSQVFFNLIHNAAKYTDDGGVIRVEARRHENANVSIKVIDNGIGMQPEDVELIFTMFTQMDAHSPRARGGVGIGLTLAERLISLHGGKITARSDGPGRGSEFEIVLPGLETPMEPEPVVTAAAPERPNASALGKVLLVDDIEDITATYSMVLEAYGYETATATTAKEAVEKFKALGPDFALLDIGMPDMSGYELCGLLQTLPGADRCIFLSQSGWGSKEDFLRSSEAGFDDHLVKPIDIERLKQLLRKDDRVR